MSIPGKTENGAVSVNPKNAGQGDRVTLTVKPDPGHVLETLTVLDGKGKALPLTDKGGGMFTFTMPNGQVEVKAVFAAEVKTAPFRDVPVDAYYYDAVKWAAEKGITTGRADGLFGSGRSCTRAQIITFLWRAAGSPEPKGAADMTDVPQDAYYAKAVAWAMENGITSGTGADRFSPHAACTRAQGMTFLFRSSKASASGTPAFQDVAADAYYAQAVKWAADNGITSGIGGGLAQHLPAGLHLPAQLAVQAVGLLHGALLPEARRFAAGPGHGLGAVTLQGTAVAQPLELRHKVEHRHAAAACSHQRAAEHLLEGGHQAGLAHQNDPGQPLQRLLDSRRVDAEQDLGAGGCIGEEGLHGSRIRKAGVICSVKADGRVHSAQQLFQLRAQLFLIGGGFKQDQIMAAGIAEQAGQQNGPAPANSTKPGTFSGPKRLKKGSGFLFLHYFLAQVAIAFLFCNSPS